MKKRLTVILIAAVLLVPQLCFAQYVNKLYDYDSTADFGTNIKIRSDGSLLIFGGAINSQTGWPGFGTLILTSGGGNLLSKNIYSHSSQGFYKSRFGRLLDLRNGTYAHPSSIGFPSSNKPLPKYAACLIKINSLGDTVFIKSYTDTALYTETFFDISKTKNGFILGGAHQSYSNGVIADGLLVRTDSLGLLVYRRTYHKANFPGTSTIINAVEALPDGRLLISAVVYSYVYVNHLYDYYRKTPWIFITDSAGNILKERFFSTKYGGDDAYASVYKDINGGYYMTGSLDSFVYSEPQDFTNFPPYLAHMDSNFSIDWYRVYADTNAHYEMFSVNQLRNGSYLIAGNIKSVFHFTYLAWAAKIRPGGAEAWQHTYSPDSLNDASFADVAERSNGSLIFAGTGKGSANPIELMYDVWIQGTDSNGCAIDCIQPLPPIAPSFFAVYPNPTKGVINIKSGQPGDLYLYNLQGQLLAQYQVDPDHTAFDLPAMAAGIYLARFAGEATKEVRVVKISYHP